MGPWGRQEPVFRAFLVVLLTWVCAFALAPRLPCHQSGYCSLRKVKPFFGDVGTSKCRVVHRKRGRGAAPAGTVAAGQRGSGFPLPVPRSLNRRLACSPGDGLRAALDARSYRKEVIVTIHGCGGPPPLLLTNLAAQLRSLGLEHLLVVSTTEVRPVPRWWVPVWGWRGFEKGRSASLCGLRRYPRRYMTHTAFYPVNPS